MPDNNDFGTGESGGNSNWSNPVHGSDAQGNDVTASFGIGSNNQGESLLSDGHSTSRDSFFGTDSDKGHDHHGSGSGPNDNGAQRGKYTGNGS